MDYGHLIDAAQHRTTGSLDITTTAYVTDGGTYVIASEPAWNDDHLPHDLVAILPAELNGSRVVPLRPTVNPDLVAALRHQLDRPGQG